LYRNKKWGILFASFMFLSLAVVFWMAGCQGGGTATTGQLTFSYSEETDPSSLDPALVEEKVAGNISRYLFDGLVRYDSQTGEVKPAVAESWDISRDATVFIFHLQKGVKFSNGREVKADDFIYAWTRALEPATKSPTAQSVLGAVKGASDLAAGKASKLAGSEALDDYTLKVTLESPLAEFPTFLGHPVSSPVPKEEVERKDVNFAEKPVGNGPYVVKEWRHNEELVLEKNPDYYGTPPQLDEIIVKIIPSASTAIAELKAGNLDVVKEVPSGQVESLRNDSSINFFQGRSDAVWFIAFDVSKPPFDNLKLRKAFTLLVDRDTIADKVLQGQQFAADGIVPSSVAGYQGGVMPAYDPEKAKTLLAEAGYPEGKGLPALILTYPDAPQMADVAQAVQASFKKANVPVEIKGMDEAAFMEAMTSGQLNFFLIAWQADFPGLDTFLQPLFHSENIGATNVFQYNNPEVDKLIENARSTTDTAERNRIYNEAERKILVDAPLIPITFGQDVLVYSPRVTNFVYTPLGDLALDEITVTNK
jgi:peptide/nickel transport system substrate-binding protein/oligopeptide transport system substrate-binding protein